MRKRLLTLVLSICLILLLGAAYAFICLHAFSVPCFFNYFTGLYCPGCGISRMFLCLMNFDFFGALHNNCAIIILSPFFAYLFISWSIKYVKTGNKNISKFQTIVIWTCIAALIIFAVLRNIPYFSFLAPI